ncbi:MAG: enoyl-CoA hydratase-related protein [Solirubrobacteraceae bacterium]
MSSGSLKIDEPAAGITRLTISNPAKRGALDHAILDGIAAALDGLESRCVILTGEPGVFSAGYDIADIPDDVFAERAEALVAHPFTRALDALEAYPFPTVAALGGHTIGGGLELALTCDMRLAAGTIKLGMPPARLGLVYSHVGLQRFIETIGVPRTRELFLRARNIEAASALAWGLVHEVHAPAELEQASLDLAQELAAGAPLSLSGNKRVLRELLAARRRLDPDVERELIELRRACFASEDMREGVRAFGEKRAPRWQNH